MFGGRGRGMEVTADMNVLYLISSVGSLRRSPLLWGPNPRIWGGQRLWGPWKVTVAQTKADDALQRELPFTKMGFADLLVGRDGCVGRRGWLNLP